MALWVLRYLVEREPAAFHQGGPRRTRFTLMESAISLELAPLYRRFSLMNMDSEFRTHAAGPGQNL